MHQLLHKFFKFLTLALFIKIISIPILVSAQVNPFSNLRPDPVARQMAIDSARMLNAARTQMALEALRQRGQRQLQERESGLRGKSFGQQLEIEKEKTRQLELQLKLKQNNYANYRGNYQKGVNAANRKDYIAALKEWIPLSKAGHLGAATNMGKLYYNGFGVPKDHAKAAKFYAYAAARGNSEAQTLLGNSYANGYGVSQNYQEAQKLWNKAAKQGHNGAQGILGWAYELGMGVPINYSKAKKWYQISANNGNKAAEKFITNLEAKLAKKKK